MKACTRNTEATKKDKQGASDLVKWKRRRTLAGKEASKGGVIKQPRVTWKLKLENHFIDSVVSNN